MKVRRLIQSTALMLVLATSLLTGGKVEAAGSAIVTVESAPSVDNGQNLELSFYVTPSGASVNSVSVDVSLTNLKYISYNASGSSFNGVAQVPGKPTASNFSVIGTYQSFGGASSKALILKVTVAATAAGDGQISLSNAVAYDTSEQAMSASSQNHTSTITGSGSTGSAGSGSTASANQPIVPGDSPGPEVKARTISEVELVAAENTNNDSEGEQVKETTVKKNSQSSSVLLALGGGLLVLLAAGTIAYKTVRKRKLSSVKNVSDSPVTHEVAESASTATTVDNNDSNSNIIKPNEK